MPQNTRVSPSEHPVLLAYKSAEQEISKRLTEIECSLVSNNMHQLAEKGRELGILQRDHFKLYTRYLNKLPSVRHKEEKITLTQSYGAIQEEIQKVNQKIYEQVASQAASFSTRAQFLQLPQPWQLYEAVNKLTQYLDSMEQYGNRLKGGDEENTADKIISLAQALKDLVNTQFELDHDALKKMPKNQEEFKNRFINNFQTKLHSLDAEITQHSSSWQNEKWKVIVANIAFAVTGLGALVLLYKALGAHHSKEGLKYKSALLFARTEVEQQVSDIEQVVEDITRYLPK